MQLAPTSDLLKAYKEGRTSEYYYKIKYREMLSFVDFEEVFKELSKYEKVVLMCYESSEKFCHRHILAEFLNERFELNVHEIEL